MPAYLITGPSGSGKTTAGQELSRRGFRAVDTDAVSDLCAWVDIESGKRETSLPPLPWSDEWMERHAFRWDQDIMESLLDSSQGSEPTFFCGGSYNEMVFLNKFKMVFGLQATNSVLAPRLIGREPERYAGNSAELQTQLDYNNVFDARCRKFGYIVINADLTPARVIDTMLTHIQVEHQ